MKSKILAQVLLPLMIATGSLSATTVHSVELNVVYTDANLLRSTHEDVAKRFEAENPGIKIKLTSVGATDEVLRLVFRDALTGSLPDLAYHAMNHVPLLAERNLGLPLDKFIQSERDWAMQGYSDAVVAMGRVGSQVYGLPFSISMPVVFYNADIILQSGADPDNFPTNWPEIVELGKRLKAPSGGIFFDYEATGNWTFISLVQSLGGAMLRPDGKVAFDDAVGARALGIMRSVGEAGAVSMTRDQARQAFAAGSLGILVTSSSGLGNYERQAAGKFQIRVAPFPIVPGGLVPAAGFALVTFAKDAEKQQAAWKYMRFATNPESQTLMVNRTGYAPVNSVAVRRSDLLGSFYDQQPNHAAIVGMLPKMTGWFAFPGENSLKINDVIKGHLRDVVTLKRKPEEVMPLMTRDVEALLPR